jgi:RNA polymerase sigma factor (sigma-70 family)
MSGTSPGGVRHRDDGEAVEEFHELLAAARGGDAHACSEIWNRYSPGVASFARNRGSHAAEDVTSEVFLAVFRQLPQFVGDEVAFRGLIFTIARRRVIDEIRRRARRPQTVTWSPETDQRRHPSAEEAAAEAAANSEVSRLLDQLSPDQRDVLLLRIVADLTVEQVATTLGKRIGAVKALQRRGLASLRRNMASGRTPWQLDSDGVQ